MHAGAPAAESWGPSPVPAPAAGPAPREAPPADDPGSAAVPSPPDVSLEQMQDAWSRSVLPAVKERSIPIATLLSEATPSGLDGDTLTLTFRPGADFHRKQVDEPANSRLLRDALYDVTGRKLAVLTAVADAPAEDDTPDESPLGEQEVISLLVSDLDATEIEETP